MSESLIAGSDSPKKKFPRLPFVGFATIILLLVSLPFIAVATGALSGDTHYSLMQHVPAEGDGAYLQVNDGNRAGVIQLYPWNFSLNEFPSDAPVFSPKHVTGLWISQPGIDDTTRYNLFRLDDDSPIDMDAQAGATKILFTLRKPLEDGKYMLDMPKSGLSSDRQYLYFVIDSKTSILPIRQSDQ